MTESPLAPPSPAYWQGNAMSTQDLCALTGVNRSTLWRDVRAGLLPRTQRRAGVKSVVYSAQAIRLYLTRKFPALLPPSQ